MQIEAVAIYRGSEISPLRLRLGGLNVVTGWPGTGKSALIDIVEYCLGRTEPTFARGALDVVEWYSVLVNHHGQRLFIARPAPSEGAASSHSAMIQLGAEDLLRPEELAVNADASIVRATLASLIGLEDVTAAAGDAPEPQRATMAQALLFCFQGQGEISNPNLLFHRSNEPFVGQAIKDSLPFFLGAVDASHLRRRARIQALRRELRKARAELDEAEDVQTQADLRASTLVNLATAVGMTLPDRAGATEALTQLRAVLAAQPPTGATTTEPIAEEERLRRSRRDLAESLRRVQEERLALTEVRQGRGAFEDELREQRARLSSLEIMGSVDEAERCPMCGQVIETDDPSTHDLRLRLRTLGKQLEQAHALEAPRRRFVQELRQRANGIRRDLRGVEAGLAAVAQARIGEETGNGEELTAPFVRGRISEFLESLTSADPTRTAALHQRVNSIESELDLLEQAVDPMVIARDVESKLAFVSNDMTEWARDLALEHAEDGVRIDLPNLTVVANDRKGAIPLRRIGSAANQVGYHVVTHLALHKWFVEESRPVPRFLFLDQPEQAYYPEDLLGVRDATERLPDLDQERVESLYRFVDDRVRELDGAFQVVIVGHWNPSSLPWFDDARVDNWRQGRALVPQRWLSSLPEARTLDLSSDDDKSPAEAQT